MSIQFLIPTQMIKRTPHGARGEVRVSNWITTWDLEEEIDVALVGSTYAKGGEIAFGTDRSPNAIRKAFVRLTTYSHDYQVDMRHLRVRHGGDISFHVTDIAQSHRQVEEALSGLHRLTSRAFVLLMGGDGSIVAPSVRALASGTGTRVGLVHFDAFHDVRETAEVGPSDATCIRTLLEDGTVQGSNLVQVGLHGFTNSGADRAFLEENGATIIPARQVHRDGIDAVVDQALAVATNGVDGAYVSVDAHVLDAACVPFSYASSPGGLTTSELMDALFRLGKDPRVRALDLVGLDTYDDPKDLMARVGASLVLSFLAGFSTREGVGGSESTS
jgi:formiminoglutamase